MACRPDPELTPRAYLAAFRSRNVAKAKLYYSRIPKVRQASLSMICVNMGIQLP